jgi:hypothetical protein
MRTFRSGSTTMLFAKVTYSQYQQFSNSDFFLRSDCEEVRLEAGSPGWGEAAPAPNRITLTCFFPISASGPVPLK